jgi:hypothetical protein
MDDVVKAKWIAALRSGEYQQAKGVLNSTAGMCCLGVLCDIYSKEHAVDWDYRIATVTNIPLELEDKEIGHFLGSPLILTDKVIAWANVDSENPQILGIKKFVTFKGEVTVKPTSLAELNDSGLSFNQIADMIQYFL